MAASVFDCARVPEKNCSVKIVGERDDVLRAAHDHLVSTHRVQPGPELEQRIARAVDEKPLTYGTWAN